MRNVAYTSSSNVVVSLDGSLLSKSEIGVSVELGVLGAQSQLVYDVFHVIGMRKQIGILLESTYD